MRNILEDGFHVDIENPILRKPVSPGAFSYSQPNQMYSYPREDGTAACRSDISGRILIFSEGQRFPQEDAATLKHYFPRRKKRSCFSSGTRGSACCSLGRLFVCILILLVFSTAAFVTYMYWPKRPEFTLKRIALGQSAKQGPLMICEWEFNNPNDFPLPLDELKFKLFNFQKESLCDAKSVTRIRVEPRSMTKLALEWPLKSSESLMSLYESCHDDKKQLQTVETTTEQKMYFEVSFILDWIHWTGYAYKIEIPASFPCLKDK